jgi:MoxR-like ATPase
MLTIINSKIKDFGMRVRTFAGIQSLHMEEQEVQQVRTADALRNLNDRIQLESIIIQKLRSEISKTIVGQTYMIDRLLIALLADGHVLLEGVPGLAKTLAIRTLSEAVDLDFSRIQFTPDLLPADVTGTMIYQQKSEKFTVKKGPVFANFVLADEINRAPAKVQSALLEAMQEKQITIGEETFQLPDPFLVLATQNPIEQEGTYPLPEAQVDRFMLKVVLGYPSKEEEKLIIRSNVQAEGLPKVTPVLSATDIQRARKLHSRPRLRHKDARFLRIRVLDSYDQFWLFAPSKYQSGPGIKSLCLPPRSRICDSGRCQSHRSRCDAPSYWSHL